MNLNVYIGHVVNNASASQLPDGQFKRVAADAPHGSAERPLAVSRQLLYTMSSFRLL
jgi:hypothetical protein